MKDGTYQIIRQAILNKEIVVATYGGSERHLCPHVLGKKNGEYRVLFYQFGGGSSRILGPDGSSTNWRCLPLSKLSKVGAYKGKWHTSRNNSRPQHCLDEIEIQASVE